MGFAQGAREINYPSIRIWQIFFPFQLARFSSSTTSSANPSGKDKNNSSCQLFKLSLSYIPLSTWTRLSTTSPVYPINVQASRNNKIHHPTSRPWPPFYKVHHSYPLWFNYFVVVSGPFLAQARRGGIWAQFVPRDEYNDQRGNF